MATDKTRSYNNGNLTPTLVMSLKKKSKRLSTVQVKVGSTKVTLPVEAFWLPTESGHGFLSLQPINAVVQGKSDGSYEAVVPKESETAVTALKNYRAPRDGKDKSKAAPVEVPAELQKLLNKLPAGYKLGIKDGKYAMVKSRARAKK